MKEIALLLIVSICCSCSVKNGLYITRDYLSEGQVGNVIISIEDDDHASVFLLRREGSEVTKEEFILVKNTKSIYNGEGLTLIINSREAILNQDGKEYVVHQVERRNHRTTRSEIEQHLADNYIVWSNDHQVTRFDLRQDSLCYLYKGLETEPYETSKWYLMSIADEYFLTFTESSNAISQVKVRNGRMYLTSCQSNDCQEKEVNLLSK